MGTGEHPVCVLLNIRTRYCPGRSWDTGDFRYRPGRQSTSGALIGKLLQGWGPKSMAGHGRAPDDVIVDPFRRSLNFEERFIREYCDTKECRKGIPLLIKKLNGFRPHSSISRMASGGAYCAAGGSIFFLKNCFDDRIQLVV